MDLNEYELGVAAAAMASYRETFSDPQFAGTPFFQCIQRLESLFMAQHQLLTRQDRPSGLPVGRS